MLAIVYAFISFIGWGSGDVFIALGTRKIGAYSMAFWSSVLGLLLSSLYIPFALADITRITAETLILNIGLGVILAIAWYLFNRALEIANPTIVGPIAAAFTSLVVVFSIVFFKETINLWQILAIIFAFIGVLFTSLDFKLLKKGIKIDRGIIYAILTMFLWGIYFTFIKIPIKEMGWYLPTVISSIVVTLFYLSMIKLKNIRIVNPGAKKALKPLLLGTVLVTTGTFSFNFALGIGLSSIVAPIAGSYPALFVLLSYFVFREKVTKQQGLGILMTLVGIITLALLSI